MVRTEATARVFTLVGDWFGNTEAEAFAVHVEAADPPEARRKLAAHLASVWVHCEECDGRPENIMGEDYDGCAYLIAAFVSDRPLESVEHLTVCNYEALEEPDGREDH